jgi:hypothetical protein
MQTRNPILDEFGREEGRQGIVHRRSLEPGFSRLSRICEHAYRPGKRSSESLSPLKKLNA